MLIALLVAVQIRQTEYTIEPPEPSSSPETILELQQKLDQLTNDIKLANTLRQNTQQAQTTSQNDNEKYLAANYDQLINTKRDSTVKKAELISLLHKQKEENLQWENQMKTIETNIKNTENEI
ncbi:MAG: hypothetical protein LBK82_05555, partial [Planctomycetaceae bacterium]|nr:hypothetical protein [Planctomycetaceae bacterium]